MFKKYMCLVLCVLMALGTMSTTALAANVVVDGLTATHVTFTDAAGEAITKLPATASKVKANVNVSNVSTTDAPVILWVGKYESDVLTDVAVTRQVISAGATDVAVSVTMDGVERNEIRETADGPVIDLTTLKAYVWTGMVGGKALAAPACFPSKSTDVAYATLDGEVWKDFSNDVTEYTITLDADDTVPTLGMVAKDNAAKITVPTLTKGENTITVVGADSATNTKSYKVNLDFTILAKKNGEVWADFDENVTDYIINLGANDAMPTFDFSINAAANMTISQPTDYYEGKNIVTFTDNVTSTTKDYNIIIKKGIVAKKNGEVWADFNEATHSYNFVLSATEAVPTFTFEATGDSVAVITQPTTWVEGYNTVIIDRNGYVEEYKFGIEYPLIATKNGETWEEFDSNTFKYDFNLARTEYPPQINFAASKPDSSITITQPTTYGEGENIVKVTRANGHERTYTIFLDYASPSVEIIDAGNSGATYNHAFFKDGVGLASDRLNWVAGGRGAGTVGMRYFTVGWREATHQNWNKNNKVSFKFRANAGGTMYVVTNGAHQNFRDAGWTQLSTGMFAMPTIDGTTYTTATLPFDYIAPDDDGQNMSFVWYQSAEVRSYPSQMSVCFKLRFEPGQLVEVPTTNNGADVCMLPLVKWDIPQPAVMDNANLNGIQYEKGTNDYVSISGFDPNVTEYDVRLDSGVTSVVVKASTAENAATIESYGSTNTSIVSDYGIIPLVGGVGKAEIKVVAPDGTTTKTYVVNFKTKKSISELPNKVYNLYTSRNSGVYTENGGYFSEDDRTNMNISRAGIEDNLDASSLMYSDRSNTYGSSATTYGGATYIRIPKNDMNTRYKWSYGGSETTLTSGWGYRYYEDADWVDPNTGKNTLYSFNVSSGATVYFIGNNWKNAPADWTKSGTTYSKHFNAGENVNIPTLGWDDSWGAKGNSAQQYFDSVVPAYMQEKGFTTASQITGNPLFGGIYDPSRIIIVWDDPSASVSNDTTISKLKVNGTAVEGFTDTKDEYDVALEMGTTSATIAIETKDAKAKVKYFVNDVAVDSVSLTTFPAVVKAKITPSDDSTDRTVVINVAVEDTARVAALTGISYKLGEDGTAVALADFAADKTAYTVEVDPTKAITVTGTPDENSTVVAPTEAVNIPFNTNLTKAVKTVEIKAKNGTATKTYSVTFKAKLTANHVYNLDTSKAGYYWNTGSADETWDKTQKHYTFGETTTYPYKYDNATNKPDTTIWYDGFYIDDAEASADGWGKTAVSDGIEFGATYNNLDDRGGKLNSSNTSSIFAGQTIIRRARFEQYGLAAKEWTYNSATSAWDSVIKHEERQKFFTAEYDGKDDNPYWYTFYISSPARVYFDTQMLEGNNWTYGAADGWTKDTTNKVGGRPTYYKDFEAGMVGIPNAGGDIANQYKGNTASSYVHTMGAYYIVWGDHSGTPTPPTPTENKAKLSAFTFTPNGGTAANVTGWTAADLGTKAYSVSVPSGTTSVAFAATAVSGATVTPATTTVDVSTGTGTATFTISDGTNTSAFTVTITVAAPPAPVGHQITISYTEERLNALKGTVTTAIGSQAGSMMGQEGTFDATYKYVDTSVSPLETELVTDRQTWRAAPISDRLMGLDVIQTSVEEMRTINNGKFQRGQGGNWEREYTVDSAAREWITSADGVFFEMTPSQNGTLYMLTYTEAPNWKNKYTTLSAGVRPTEFNGFTDHKYVPYDTTITSNHYYLTLTQWNNVDNIGKQFTDTTNTAITSFHPNAQTMTYAYKVDFTANTKLSVAVPGVVLPDMPVFLVEWDDEKVANPVLSTLKYSVDGGAETAVADFAADTKEYTVDGLAGSTTSVTVSATAPTGMTVTVTQPTFDESGVGVATILVKSGTYKQETYKVTFKKDTTVTLTPDTVYNLTVNGGYYSSGNYPAPPTADGEEWLAGSVHDGREGTYSAYKIYDPNEEDRTGDYFCDYYLTDPSVSGAYDKISVVRNMIIGTTNKYNDRSGNPAKVLNANTSDYFKNATLIARGHSDASEAVAAQYKVAEGKTVKKGDWGWSFWDRSHPVAVTKAATYQPYISGAFDGKGTNPYWMEFVVSSGAHVFVTAPNSYAGDSSENGKVEWINAPSDWTKNSTTTLQLDNMSNFYYKHYNAGEKVQIPNWGVNPKWTASTQLYDPPIIVVVWDSANPTGPEGSIEEGGEGLASL